jgi:hypothetical protein
MYKYVILVLALAELVYGICKKSRKHTFSGVIILVIFGIVFLVSSGTQSGVSPSNKELIEETVAEIKAELPMHGDSMSFTDIDGTEDSMIYTYTLDRETSERFENDKNELNLYKRIFTNQLLANPQTRLLLEKDIKLVFKYINPENKLICSFRLDKKDIHKQKEPAPDVQRDSTPGAQAIPIEEELKLFADEYNKELPVMQTEETRLDSVMAGPGRKFTYKTTITTLASEEIDREAFAEYVKPKLIENYKSSKELKDFRDKNVEFIYLF